jgi:hypothetical protein
VAADAATRAALRCTALAPLTVPQAAAAAAAAAARQREKVAAGRQQLEERG